MKKQLFLFIATCCSLSLMSQTTELFPYGDFEQWVVRYIKESAILGGETRVLYAVGKSDTIRENKAFIYGLDNSPWASSNAYAKVAFGIEKASLSMQPERRGDGWCVRLDSKLEKVKAAGMINVTVEVSGTIFTGKMLEPVKDANDPYKKMDAGVPFTKKPKALVIDYKCNISPEQTVTKASGGKIQTIEGHDEAQAFLLLQKRWEDASGNVYAKRIGTAYERFSTTQSTWVNGHAIPVRYGDITTQPDYHPYEGLGTPFYVQNSKGKMVPLQENSYGDENDTPTHIIIFITAGCYPAFTGHVGNAMWVDNVKLAY